MVHILTFLGLYRKEAFEMMVSRVIEVDLKKKCSGVLKDLHKLVDGLKFYILYRVDQS